MLYVVFVAKSAPYNDKSSTLINDAGFDSLLDSFEFMMGKESPPRGGDPLMVLCDLQRKKDILIALDLSSRIKETTAKLRASREEQLREVVRLRAINATSEV